MAHKKISTSFSFNLKPYPFNCLLSIGQSDSELNKTLTKHKVTGDRSLAEYNNGYCRYVVWFDDRLALIRIPELPRTATEYGSLAHEILHVVISVLRYIGMKISDDNGSDEAYTYFMSYITSTIYYRLNKYY